MSLLLVPIPGGGNRQAEGSEQGWITAAASPGSLAVTRRFRVAVQVSDILDGDRGD